MATKMIPWDQRLARILVRPLARTPVTPNQVTAFTLVLALAGAALLGTGDTQLADWGPGLFILARFFDHFDGELARLKGSASSFGYYFDYAVGGISYAALFGAIGIGLAGTSLGGWSLALGAAGAAAALISMFLNLGIDRANGHRADGEAVGYPGIAGFELEDGIYLLGPLTWAGFLQPFFLAAGIGAAVYCVWTFWCLVKARGARTLSD